LSLADLRKIESHTVTNTLECAGNGRGLYQPHVPGVQWQKGAVGTGRFAGPRLKDLLQRTGLKPTGKHVMFHGLDEVPGKVPPFIRSIPIEKAMDADTLVATQMRGRADQGSWISSPRPGTGLGRCGFVQMAYRNQGARQGIRRQLHETRLPHAERTGEARRVRQSRCDASLNRARSEIADCQSKRWRDA